MAGTKGTLELGSVLRLADHRAWLRARSAERPRGRRFEHKKLLRHAGRSRSDYHYNITYSKY